MKSAFELLAAGGALESVAKAMENIKEHNIMPLEWLAVLAGLLGDLSHSVSIQHHQPAAFDKIGGLPVIRKDAVSLAAMTTRMIECLDRMEKKGSNDAKQIPD